MPFQQFKLRESFQYSFEMLVALHELLVLCAVVSASSYCMFTFNCIMKFSLKTQNFHCQRMYKNIADFFLPLLHKNLSIVIAEFSSNKPALISYSLIRNGE